MNLALWAEEQKAALIDAGVHPHDAERAVSWVVDHLPPGEDPDTWIPARQVITDAVRGSLLETFVDAKAVWYSDPNRPERYALLLDSVPVLEPEKQPTGPGGLTTFVTAFNHYYNAQTLRPIPPNAIQSVMDDHVRHYGDMFADLAGAVQQRQIAPSLFVRQMQTDMRRLSLHTAALGGGGLPLVRDDILLQIDANLMDSYARINEMAKSIMADELSFPQSQARAQMYAGSARQRYFDAAQANHETPDGMLLIERRALTPADHCADCVRYDGMGWQHENYLPPPGVASACRSNCRCRMYFFHIFPFEAEDWIGTKRKPLTDREDLERVQKQERENRKRAGIDSDAPRGAVVSPPPQDIPIVSAPPPAEEPKVVAPPPPKLGLRERLNGLSYKEKVIAVEEFINETMVDGDAGKFHGVPVVHAYDKIEYGNQEVHFRPQTRQVAVQSIVNWHTVEEMTPAPSTLTAYTRKIYFDESRNAQDAHWEKVYNMPGFMSSATGGDSSIVVYNNLMLPFNSYLHEMGHNMAMGVYGSSAPGADSAFAKATVGEPPYTSYAAVHIAEDFAESISHYINNRFSFVQLAPQRASVIDRILRLGHE